jgi:hypothetical protein
MVSCSKAGQHKDPDVATYLVDNQSTQCNQFHCATTFSSRRKGLSGIRVISHR